MHCVLREPQVARRSAMRPLVRSSEFRVYSSLLVRLRRLLGPDAQSAARPCADVDACTCGVTTSNARECCTLLGLMS